MWLKIDAKFCTVSTVCKNSWRGRRNVRVTVSSSAQVPFSDIFGERTLRGLKILAHFPGQFLGQFCTPIFSEFSGSKHTPNSGTMYAPQRRSMISFRIPFGKQRASNATLGQIFYPLCKIGEDGRNALILQNEGNHRLCRWMF